MRRPGKPRPQVFLTRGEFDNLLEYSGSIPTGVTAGKIWKRNTNACVREASPQWVLCCYFDNDHYRATDRMGMAYFDVVVVDLKSSRSRWLDTWEGEGDPRRLQ